jgi:hypothetical protein
MGEEKQNGERLKPTRFSESEHAKRVLPAAGNL